MLFQIIDTNENGVIDFSEFKACLLRSQIALNEDLLRKAFNFFDKDKSGFLTKEELMQVFSSYDDVIDMYDPEDFDDLLRECDRD
jgi:calcium-dependent protein kinase